MANTFDWIQLGTGDMGRAAEFYERLFGWEVIQNTTANGSDYWIFDTGDEPRVENLRRGALCLRPDHAGPGILVYVFVEDIDAVLRKLVDLGGEVVVPKHPVGSASTACFSDPDGNLLGLWQE